MKRINNLWDQFISKDNFELAWRLTKKRRSNRRDIQKFMKNKEANLETLRQDIINGTYKLSEYRNKVINERGKIRKLYILKLRDRIVQHALINIIEDIYVKSFITHTYGCIKGRGQLKGSYYLRKIINFNQYCLKLDIRQYYPTINHDILYTELCKRIKDKKLLNLIKMNVYSVEGGKNCPIGNLTSQLFGNVYLNKLDQYCKHILKIRYYIRYCDDIVILSNDKKYLSDIKHKIDQFVQNELKQELSFAQIFDVKQGIDFLGYRHFKGYTILRKKNKLNFTKSINRMLQGKDKRTIEKQFSALSSYSGIIDKCDARIKNIVGYNMILNKLNTNNFLDNKSLYGTPISITKLVNKQITILGYSYVKIKRKDKIVTGIKVVLTNGISFKSSSKVLIEQLKYVEKDKFPLTCTLEVG